MRGVNGLQRLSLLLVIVGLATIYASTHLFGPETVEISDIGEEDLGKSVRVAGVVRDISTSDDVIFFHLAGEKESIRSVHFGSSLELEEDESYTLDGRVEIYRGELEFVAENVVSTGSTPD